MSGDPARGRTRSGSGTTTSVRTSVDGCFAGAGAGRPRRPPPDDGVVGRIALRDLTPAPGRALDERQYDVSADGRTVVTTWRAPEPGGRRVTLVAIDVATGERRIAPRRSRTRSTGCRRSRPTVCAWRSSSSAGPRLTPPRVHLAVLDLAARRAHRRRRRLGPLAAEPCAGARTVRRSSWSADDDGRAPVFRIDLPDGDVTRLTADDAAYSDLQVSPGRRCVYALRAAVDAPPAPVRLDARRPDQEPEPLPVPGPGSGAARHPDRGHRDRRGRHAAAGLAGAARTAPAPHAPAPLLLWIHGGPLALVERLVVAVEPVAHGRSRATPCCCPTRAVHRVRAGVHPARLGSAGAQAPYTDLMAITDAAVARARHRRRPHRRDGRLVRRLHGQLDRRAHRPVPRRSSRTPASGRWTSSRPTTDASYYWRAGDDGGDGPGATARTGSSTRSGRRCWSSTATRTTGCPIGEALRLWSELAERADADGSAAQVPLLPGREPLGAQAAARQGLVPGGRWPSSTPPCTGRTGRSPTSCADQATEIAVRSRLVKNAPR